VIYELRGERWRHGFAADRLIDMQVPIDEASVEVMGRYLLEMAPTRQLAQDDLPPALRIFGEFEVPSDSPFSDGYVPIEGESPHRVHVVPRAPHSYYILGGPFGLVSYHPEMLDSLVTAAEEWAVEHAGRHPAETLRR
jgi:hypothetical protein